MAVKVQWSLVVPASQDDLVLEMQNEIAIRNVFTDLPVIETARLRLRRLQLDDAGSIFAYASDPELTRHRSWPTHLSIDDSRSFIAETTARYERGDVADWGIERREQSTLIGTVGFQWVRDGYIAAVGFTLARAYRNQGLEEESIRSVIAFGFEYLNLHRIQATARDSDIDTQQVLEDVGMICEGTLRDYRYQKGRFVTVQMYAALRGDYR